MVDPHFHVLWSNDNQLEYLTRATRQALYDCWLTGELDRDRLDRVHSLLRACSTNLDSAKVGYRLAERLAGTGGPQLLEQLGGGDWDTVEHAAMSLAVEDVATAMDLCAAVIQALVADSPSRWGTRVWDIRSAKASQIPDSCRPMRVWLTSLRHSEDYGRLVVWRHAMVHRSYEKVTQSVSWSASGAVETEERAPSTIFVRADNGTHVRFELPADLGTSVLLGVRQFRAFCTAASEAALAHRR